MKKKKKISLTNYDGNRSAWKQLEISKSGVQLLLFETSEESCAVLPLATGCIYCSWIWARDTCWWTVIRGTVAGGSLPAHLCVLSFDCYQGDRQRLTRSHPSQPSKKQDWNFLQRKQGVESKFADVGIFGFNLNICCNIWLESFLSGVNCRDARLPDKIKDWNRVRRQRRGGPCSDESFAGLTALLCRAGFTS